jgi:hypothetical protein
MNKKNKIVLITLGALLMNGCVVKEKFVSEENLKKKFSKQKMIQKKIAPWKTLKSNTKEACIDCYATPGVGTELRMAKLEKNEVLTYDYSKAPADTFNNTVDYSILSSNSKIQSVERNTKVSSYNYDTQYYAHPVSYVNSSYGSFTTKTAIQIGAFRRYAGAQIYAKKYDLLSSNYHVKIETGMKDNMPLHRVRIGGFSTRGEAQKFIARYGISDAFLVRR